MAAPSITLYGTATSRVCKVLWALQEIGLSAERIDVPTAKLAADPAYRALNSKGTVPTAVIHSGEGGRIVLGESNTIVSYLANRFDGRGDGLYPATPEGVARAWEWLEHGEAFLQPSLSPLWAGLRRQTSYPPTPGQGPDLVFDERTGGLHAVNGVPLARTMAAWGRVEAQLEDKDYLLGERLTMADITAGVHANRLFNLPRDRLPKDPRECLPATWAWHQRLVSRHAYAETVVFHQP